MVPKKPDNFFISSLDHGLHPLLGISKAYLNKVENSPGSSFCSAAAHYRCPLLSCFYLSTFSSVTTCWGSTLSYWITESFPLYVNTKLFERLGGKKGKKKPVAHGLSFKPLLVMGKNKLHPNLTSVLLKTIPVFPELPPQPLPQRPPSSGSCQQPYSLWSPTNRNHPPAPGWLHLSPLRCLLGCDPCLLSWPCFIGCSNRSWNGY